MKVGHGSSGVRKWVQYKSLSSIVTHVITDDAAFSITTRHTELGCQHLVALRIHITMKALSALCQRGTH